MKALPTSAGEWYNPAVDGFEVLPLGDSALLLRAVRQADDADGAASLLRARSWIEAAAIPGICETVLGYATLAVFFDPAAVCRAGAPSDGVCDWLGDRLETAVESNTVLAPPIQLPAAVEVPVCYDPVFAPDLEEVARTAGLDPCEVIRLHSSASYTVRCVGFTPGFPYLSGLPPELATPRRADPRKSVPAGAVAIGGNQAGIYPAASPGGWNVIGRTPLRLFDPQRDPPALLHAGDTVRFCTITHEQFSEATRHLR